MPKYVKIVDGNDAVVDNMYCLKENSAEHALCSLLNNGADVYMQDISGMGTMVVSDVKEAENEPNKKKAEVVGHLPFFLDPTGQYISEDSPDFKNAMEAIVDSLQAHAVGSIHLITSATDKHPHVPGSHVLVVTALADDFDLEVNQVIELFDEQDFLPSPM
jgi:hypothetical protein